MPTINFRMTDEQHAELVRRAQVNGRSVQKEIELAVFGAPAGFHRTNEEWVPAAEGTFDATVGLPPQEGTFGEVLERVVEYEEATARSAPAPSVPPAAEPARKRGDERPAKRGKGPCPHRVPEGKYCKRCGA